MDKLSLKEAAEVCKVSTATIRRRKDDLRRVGAICEPSGWQIRLDHLIAVGLTTKIRGGTPDTATAVAPVDEALIKAMQSHIATLEADLLRERIRADRAEAMYDRLIEAPPTQQTLEPAPAPVVEEPQRQGFFRRLFG